MNYLIEQVLLSEDIDERRKQLDYICLELLDDYEEVYRKYNERISRPEKSLPYYTFNEDKIFSNSFSKKSRVCVPFAELLSNYTNNYSLTQLINLI